MPEQVLMALSRVNDALDQASRAMKKAGGDHGMVNVIGGLIDAIKALNRTVDEQAKQIQDLKVGIEKEVKVIKEQMNRLS